MGIEIDFLPVGEESKGGDAIALRWGNLHGTRAEQTVMIVDGGYAASGDSLVEHVTTRYGTDHVDIVLSTHPDRDHVAGLEVVLEKLSVGQLLMHQPWKHSAEVAGARVRAFKETAMPGKLEESLREASDLEAIAARKGIPIIEPFTGVATGDGTFRVLGPTKEYYEQLLGEAEGGKSAVQRLVEALAAGVEKAKTKLVPETLTHETLRDDGVTSPQNNTSVISLIELDGKKHLLTADAGVPALERAADELKARGIQPGDLDWVQIPHHGSRRNVGPSILDRLLGPKGQSAPRGVAFVSTPAKNPEQKHPAKKALNAFTRRGYPYHATSGSYRLHQQNAPERSDFHTVTPGPFHNFVEEDSDA